MQKSRRLRLFKRSKSDFHFIFSYFLLERGHLLGTFSVYTQVKFPQKMKQSFPWSFEKQQIQKLNSSVDIFFREKLTLVKMSLLQIVIDFIFRIPKSFGDRAHALFSSNVQ